MKYITNDLFYSSSEGILFWIAGYTKDGNTYSVKEIIESFKYNALKFAQHAGVDFDEVKTFYNNKPRRYQYMRIFYTDVPKNIEGAFTLGKQWTMREWITY